MTHAWFNRLRPVFLLLLVGMAACGGDSGTSPLVPARLEVLEGDDQTATVGNLVASAPAVRVTTRDGRAVAGVTVVFTVESGGGSLAGAQQQTGSDGVARVDGWTLGTVAGEQRVSAASARLSGLTATFNAQARADVPATLVIATQPPRGSASGAALTVQPVVRTADRFGNVSPRPGVTVTATLDRPAAIANATAVTDATGTAVFNQLAITGTVGLYTLEFGAEGLTAARADGGVFLNAGAPHHLAVSAQPAGASFPLQPLRPGFTVLVADAAGNTATAGGFTVRAELEGGAATLSGTTSVVSASGIASFTNLIVSAPGNHSLRFSADGVGTVTAAVTIVTSVPLSCGDAGTGAFKLDLALGATVRRVTSDADTPTCLEFDAARARGQQYLLLFENMPAFGDYGTGLFTTSTVSPFSFQFDIESQPATSTVTALPAIRAFPNAVTAPARLHDWDFGSGPIYEGEVTPPAGGLPLPRLLHGNTSSVLSASVVPSVGDTLQVYLEGIARLGIPGGTQKAVVRHISDHLIFAEDIRLASLPREGGGFSTPLTQDTMRAIAAEYAKYAAVQGDLFFQSRHNAYVEGQGTPNRIVAVQTIMYANNVWGYTYSSGNYFAYDYWVGTAGSAQSCAPTVPTSPCLAQRAQRVADNLFMHEIAHMRHYGAFDRSGQPQRGNRWLVEGFARFTERLPIAMRLLGSSSPSRTSNLRLPYNSTLDGFYFLEDVPPYVFANSSMLEGYGASSYVFDYFADQVAYAGGDPLAALRDLLVSAGSDAALDAAIGRWLPGVTFPELFTRARIALFADDYGEGLPAWMQYHQYDLRLSRPAGNNAALDPRNNWLRLAPGRYELVQSSSIPAGSARGIIIDGSVAAAESARILIGAAKVPNGVISITRIR